MGQPLTELQALLEDSYLTRVVERIAITGSLGLLSDSVSEHWRLNFEALVSEFHEISSVPAFNQWMDRFWLAVYTLARNEPNSFRGTWARECMMRALPTGEQSRHMAWSHVKRYGVLGNDGAFKTMDDLTFQVFAGLLCVGDMDAFSMLKRLVLNEFIAPPSRDVCFWFRYGFLKHYSGGHRYHDNVQLEEKRIGYAWESLCYLVAKILHGEILEQPILINKKRPDILPLSDGIVWEDAKVKHAPLLIECKNSELSYSPEGLSKYLPFCDTLEVWVLETPSREAEPAAAQINRVYGKELANKVHAIDGRLHRSIMDLEREASPSSIDARLLHSHSGLSLGTINEIWELHEFFKPYYKVFEIR